MEVRRILLWLTLIAPLFGMEEFYADFYDNNLLTGDHSIVRRSINECHKSADASQPSINYHAFNPSEDSDHEVLSLLWVGEENKTRIVVLSSKSEDKPAPSIVYQSKLVGEAYNFKRVEGPLTNFTVSKVGGVQKNPHSPGHILLIGVKDSSYQTCISKDAGDSFNCNPLVIDGESYEPAGTFIFTKDHVMTILLSVVAQSRVLVISNDQGESWHKVAAKVSSAIFQPDDSNIIFAMVTEPQGIFALFGFEPNHELKKMDVSDITALQTTTSPSLKNITSISGYQYIGKFLHIVCQDEEGHKIFKMSKDHGKTFSDIHIPAMESGQYISILDTPDELVLVQVSSSADSTVGTLYTSDLGGKFYSQSLEEHVRDDFYKVQSVDGVYITSQKQADDSLRTLISRDRGRSWTGITVKDCGKESCGLQIYSKYLINYHLSVKQSVLAQAPYSNPNARGIIVVHGMLGDKIPHNPSTLGYNYPDARVFISSDGGLNWFMVDEGFLKGPHYILVADHGGMIQALPVASPVNKVLYSMDEGVCWHEEAVNQTPAGFKLKGIVAQPGHKSLRLGIMGFIKGEGEPVQWSVLDINFKPVATTKCGNDDFTSWTQTEQCYLGMMKQYRRVKASSWCYLGEDFDHEEVINHCPCSERDYECSYGYVTNDKTGKCERDEEFKSEVTFCLDGYKHEVESSGYRLIPGDKCDGNSTLSSFTPPRVKKLGDRCDAGDSSTYLSMEEVQGKVCNSAATASPTTQVLKSKGMVAAVVILFLLCVVFACAFVVSCLRLRKMQRQFEYQSFESNSWSVNGPPATSTSQTSAAREESSKISSGFNKTYSRLQETGSEPDVDLLNL